ncbi:MAG: caspase family protein [Pseudomonadota bacterium]
MVARLGVFAGILMLICMSSVTGCVSIPVGQEILEVKEIGNEHMTDKILRSATLKLDNQGDDGALVAKLEGDYEVRECDEIQLRKKVKYRKLIVGFYPGAGSRLWVNITDDIEVDIFAAPFMNAVVLLAPTWLPWFSEFNRSWEPAIGESMDPMYSLFGWAKTADSENIPVSKLDAKEKRALADIKADTTLYQSVREEKLAQCKVEFAKRREAVLKKYNIDFTEKKNTSTRTDREPIPYKPLVLRIPSLEFEATQHTDKSGRATFLPVRFPIVTDKALTAEVSAADLNTQPLVAKTVIPASILGKKLDTVLTKQDCRYNKVYLPEGEIDFSPGQPGLAPMARVSVDIQGQELTEPEYLVVKVTVRNDGRGSLYRLMGKTFCRTAPQLGDHLLIFGKIDSGQTVTRKLRLPLSGLAPDAKYDIQVEFSEPNNNYPPPVALALNSTTLKRPNLAWTYEVVDDPELSKSAVGNADGVIQIGEAFDLIITVKNIGDALAKNVILDAILPESKYLNVYRGKLHELDSLEPGETKRVVTNIQIKSAADFQRLSLKVRTSESGFGVNAEKDMALPFDTKIAPPVKAENYIAYVKSKMAVFRSGASEKASEYARAPVGTELNVVAETQLGDWAQVEVTAEKGKALQRVWVKSEDLSTMPLVVAVRDKVQNIEITRFNNPPMITFIEPTCDLQTNDDRLKLVVNVVDVDGRLKNVELFGGTSSSDLRGINVKPKEWQSLPEAEDKRDSVVMSRVLSLAHGDNVFQVVAIDDEGARSTSTLKVIRRRKAGKTYLVSIGIDSYPDQHRLECAVKDAKAFRECALNNMGVKQEATEILIDSEATASSIRRTLGGLRMNARPEDTVIIFYAGHGTVVDVGGRIEEYLVTYGADWDNLPGTAIAMEEFDRLLRLRAERLLVIADACYSGAIKVRGSEEIFKGLTGKGRILIGYQGAAREDVKLGHGYLTYYITEALEGKGDLDRNGKVTLREAYEYASEKIKKMTGTGLWIKGEGDLELASNLEKS